MIQDLQYYRALGLRDIQIQAIEEHAQNQEEPARIIEEHKDSYTIISGNGSGRAFLSGKLRFELTAGNLPATGDWVLTGSQEPYIITELLPRFSKFSRKIPGKKTTEQIIAANVDLIFLVMSLDNNFNLRRAERYLSLIQSGGADPVILLNKVDLLSREEAENKLKDILTVTNVPVHLLSAITGEGKDIIASYLKKGITIALTGSSGVGKSSIINALTSYHVQETGETRNDDKGRHTTTSRKIFFLEQGCMLLDTPGMRELQLWDAEEGISEVFSDILELAEHCKYSDCTHDQEPGCAVKKAMEEGNLSQDRYRSYHKLKSEASKQQSMLDENFLIQKRKREKAIHKEIKKMLKERGRR